MGEGTKMIKLLMNFSFLLFMFSDEVFDVSIVYQCLVELNEVATTKRLACKEGDHWMRRNCYKGYDWITDLFGDQDDALFEAMMTLLNIHLLIKKKRLVFK